MVGPRGIVERVRDHLLLLALYDGFEQRAQRIRGRHLTEPVDVDGVRAVDCVARRAVRLVDAADLGVSDDHDTVGVGEVFGNFRQRHTPGRCTGERLVDVPDGLTGLVKPGECLVLGFKPAVALAGPHLGADALE